MQGYILLTRLVGPVALLALFRVEMKRIYFSSSQVHHLLRRICHFLPPRSHRFRERGHRSEGRMQGTWSEQWPAT